MYKKNNSSPKIPGEDYLNKFKPLQIVVRGGHDATEQAIKAFKVLVQRSGVLSEYKESQRYEKPSIKKRRKKREAEDKRLAYEYKMRLIQSGEWDKRAKKKQQKRENQDG